MRSIGIIMLDNDIPRPVGDIGNPDTYAFPVVMETSHGACTNQVIEHAAAGLTTSLVDSVARLEAADVAAITTCCGFLAVHQRALADATNRPVASSALLQIPLVLHTLRSDQCVCVITANAKTLGDQHFEAAGVLGRTRDRVHVVGLEETAHFYGVVTGIDHDLDTTRAQVEVLGAARSAVADHPEIGAFVLECTNLPPYTDAIRRATGLPVWDMRTLTSWLHAGTVDETD